MAVYSEFTSKVDVGALACGYARLEKQAKNIHQNINFIGSISCIALACIAVSISSFYFRHKNPGIMRPVCVITFGLSILAGLLVRRRYQLLPKHYDDILRLRGYVFRAIADTQHPRSPEDPGDKFSHCYDQQTYFDEECPKLFIDCYSIQDAAKALYALVDDYDRPKIDPLPKEISFPIAFLLSGYKQLKKMKDQEKDFIFTEQQNTCYLSFIQSIRDGLNEAQSAPNSRERELLNAIDPLLFPEDTTLKDVLEREDFDIDRKIEELLQLALITA